jgi:hypothetical protein
VGPENPNQLQCLIYIPVMITLNSQLSYRD